MGESLQVWPAGHILLNRENPPKSPARPYGSRRVPGGNMRRSMQPACWDYKPRVSVLAEELLCRLHGLRAEIVVADAGETHEAFGRVDQAIEALGQRHRHDIVAVPLHHHHPFRDLADAQIRADPTL